MRRLAVLGVLALVLAVPVVRGRVTVAGDLAAARWIATGGRPSAVLVAHAAPVALERDRFDPVLSALGRALGGGVAGFEAMRAAGVALGLLFAGGVALEAGAGAAWTGALLAALAVVLGPVARLGHPLWLLSPWPAALVWALVRLARAPGPGAALGAAAALALSAASTRAPFLLALLPAAGFVLVAGPRSPGRGAAAVGLAAAAVALVAAAVPPLPEPHHFRTLAQAAEPLTLRTLLAAFQPGEALLLAPLLLAAPAAALASRGARRALAGAAILLWLSFSWRAPAALHALPRLRLFDLLPGGEEHEAAVLLAVPAAALALGAGAWVCARRLPPAAGAALAAVLLVLRLAVAPGSPPLAEREASGEPPPAGSIAWPLDPVALAERAAGERALVRDTLAPETLAELGRWAGSPPQALWSEAFLRAAERLQVDSLVPDGAPPAALPAWLSAGSEGARVVLRLDAGRGLARFASLVPVPADGWSASSTTRSPEAFPERLAFDGDSATRWAVGAAQAPGDVLEIDLGREVGGVTRVVIDQHAFLWDFPRALAVEVVTESGAVERVAADPQPRAEGGELVLDFAPRAARRIRLVQGGRTALFDWSVPEIRVWREP